MEAQFCANENCLKHTEHCGGRFIFNSKDGKTYCADCHRVRVVMNDGRNLYDFTTTHFDGSLVHVRSKLHLRECERKYGVSSCVANMEQSHWDR